MGDAKLESDAGDDAAAARDRRDALLAVLRERLSRSMEIDCATHVLGPETLEPFLDLAVLVAGGRSSIALDTLATDQEAASVLGQLAYRRWEVRPGLGAGDAAVAIRLLAPLRLSGSVEELPPQLESWCQRFGLDEGFRNDAGRYAEIVLFPTPSDLLHRAEELYKGYGDSEDAGSSLLEAITLQRRAVAVSDGEVRGARLFLVGIYLVELLETFDVAEALDDAIEAMAEAAYHLPAAHPLESTVGEWLKDLSQRRYARTRLPAHLRFFAWASCRAVEAPAPDETAEHQAMRRLRQGVYMRGLREQTGVEELRQDELYAFRSAVRAAPVSSETHLMARAMLGSCWQSVYEDSGDIWALRRAIVCYRVPAEGLSASTDASLLFSALAEALAKLSDLEGDPGLVEQAITAQRVAVQLSPDGDPQYHLRVLRLSAFLGKAAYDTGREGPLREAVGLARQGLHALEATGVEPEATHRITLGAQLVRLYAVTRDLDLLVEAETQLQPVVLAPDGDPQTRARAAEAFAHAMVAASTRAPDAVPFLRSAVDALTVGLGGLDDSNRQQTALTAALLATMLCAVGQRTHDTESLARSADLAETLLEQVEYLNPEVFAQVHATLGMIRSTQYADSGVIAQREEASKHLRLSARTEGASARARLPPCMWALRHATNARNTAAVHQMAGTALHLLPRIASRRASMADRRRALHSLAGVAERLAVSAVVTDDPTAAIERVEQSRGLLLSETLELRTGDWAQVERLAPQWAEQLTGLREELAQLDSAEDTIEMEPGKGLGSAPSTVALSSAGAVDSRTEARWERRQRVGEAWEDTLRHVRAVPSLQGFLRPPDIKALSAQAREGAIVMPYTEDDRSDALILTANPDRPAMVAPLPGLTPQDAHAHTVSLWEAMRASNSPDASLKERAAAQASALKTLEWLWDVVAEPVLTQLEITGTPMPGSSWPRLWWSPMGRMSMLPLHAAGYHADNSGGTSTRSVMDRVVPSYTPTVRALAAARQQARAAGTTSPDAAASPLVVTASGVPQAVPLPSAEREGTYLASLLTRTSILSDATRAGVLEALPGHALAHFAYHGVTDTDTPANSALLLQDHIDAPLTVGDLSRLHLPHAQLAFLSACSTTASTPRSANEATHLTGAFQMAGFPRVIGTLWPVNDGAAQRVAMGFYDRLTSSGNRPAAVTVSAHALHAAVRELRDTYPRSPSMWAAHLHSGA